MKKLVTVILSLVLLLAVCASATAAVKIPTTPDQTAISSLGLTANSPSISVEKVDDAYVVTVLDDLADYSDWRFSANYRDPDIEWENSWATGESLGNNQFSFVCPKEGYVFDAFLFSHEGSSDNGDVYYDNYFDASGVNYESMVSLSVKENGASYRLDATFDENGNIIHEYNGGLGYNVLFTSAGSVTNYTLFTETEDGANLTLQYDRFGRLTYLNWWDEDEDYYWNGDYWYDMEGEPISSEFIPVDPASFEAPYAAPYIANTPALKVENVDLNKIDLEILEDGTACYYDGVVNAWYNEDGSLNRYFYFNLEGTEEYQFHFAPNGTLICQQTYEEKADGFYLVSDTQYYANSGAPKSHYYVAETGEDVWCAADGTVEQLSFYDAEAGIQYIWDSWSGWYAWNDEGEEVAVDTSAMPNVEAFKGPALVTVTAVTKDDVKVAPTAAATAPTLPVALAELPSITDVALEGNKLSVSVSDELDEMSFYNEDNFQDVYLYVNYMQGDEFFSANTLYNDVITYSLESDPVFYYNAETKTYDFELPEGAEDVSYGIYVDRIIDNMTYYYSITEDGVNVSIRNAYLNDVYQAFTYEDGKLVQVYTSLDDYYLTTNYDAEGNLESYRYPVAEDNHATFLPDGTLDYIRYYDSKNEQSIYWDATNGWHTREYTGEDDDAFVPTAVEKPADAVDPEDVEPLVIVSKKPQHIWFPHNTLGLAAVSLKDLGISSDWHNVAPVDLTKDGTTVFTLVGADAWILGQAYVTVADGNVTVDYAILDGHGYMKEEKLNWFLSKADLTEENLKAESNYAFGEPVSIADQLGGAETAILFIDSKITFRQPYFDAFNYSTRYYRNRENWKEYREALIEMIGE